MTEGPDDRERATRSDNELEAALRLALRQEDAPDGFTDRVLARASGSRAAPATVQPGKAGLLTWPRRRVWLGSLIAAALVVGVFEGEVAYKHVREQQRRVWEATRQFQTTERITVHALAQAREQLQRAGVPLDLD